MYMGATVGLELQQLRVPMKHPKSDAALQTDRLLEFY